MSEPSHPAEHNSEPEGLEQRGGFTDRDTVALAEDNSLVPACNLPAEILSTIFLNLSQLPDRWIVTWDPEGPEAQRIPQSRRIVFTHVCRAWRAVALDDAALWTTLPMTSPTITELALSRTKGALLCIEKSILLQRHVEAVEKLLLSQPVAWAV
ncbi:hypothetical protein FA13DRAFT_1733888 [Coprinellus micaceus]|uniref:Uncharacterized protein n=1 Tax=Coprinellus micaceus TaxID=71717 RepID=A0A4Y7T7Z6_COPMI|nr:hypothetical protein FA13DRAFT_1733888 [Coprinellus micaceus]